MYAPKLYESEQTRDIIQTFGGYNHNLRIGDNEFYDMKNMSSTNYPTLSPRLRRGIVKSIPECNGLLAKDELAYVQGNTLHYGDFSMELDDNVEGERQLISMGAYIIVFPDMMYLNTSDFEDHGEIYNDGQTFGGKLKFTLCDGDGTELFLNSLLLGLYDGQNMATNFWCAKPHFSDKGYNVFFNALTNEKQYIYGIPQTASQILGDYEVYHEIEIKPIGWGYHDETVVFDWGIEAGVFWIKIKDELCNDLCERLAKSAANLSVLRVDAVFGKITVTRTIKYVGGNGDKISETYNRVYQIISPAVLPNIIYDAPLYTYVYYAGSHIPIAVNDKRLTLNEGKSVVERCINVLTEDDTDQDVYLATWNEPACWQEIPTYVKIESLSSIGEATQKIIDERTSESFIIEATDAYLQTLSKEYHIDNVKMVKDNSKYEKVNTIMIYGCLDFCTETETMDATVTYKTIKKHFDYLTESGNRLWACRYGLNNKGDFVNEIYASAQGSFASWDAFDGTANDSYVASVGSDGPFTGVINYRGQPIFFKENCYHMVYGSYPENYQIVTDTGTGLQNGSHKSLCIVQNVLYYKASDGIYRFDGSSYDKISDALGLVQYGEAAAGSIDDKYYIAMTDENGIRELFVYDIGKRAWHKEDAVNARYFARYKGDLYFYAGDTDNLFAVKGTQGAPKPDDIEWFAETGIIGYSTPDAKYISKIQLRLSLPVGSRVNFYIEYDSDGYYQFIGGLAGKSFQAFSLPIFPRRCDHFKLRIVGVGECKIFSLSKVMEAGGEL